MTLPRARLAALLSATALLVCAPRLHAQWIPQSSSTQASFRGMSVVTPATLWISGTQATFAWTDDGGRQWHSGRVAAAGSFDFRSVHAFSLDSALLMVSAQDTALIYRTTDRGRTWSIQYRDESKGAFLDAMAFFDSRNGLAVGDPVNGHFVVLSTSDGGEHWARLAGSDIPPSLAGEGAFAASGTAMITCGSSDVWFATGGARVSRVFHSADAGRTWSVAETPVRAGSAPAGIFSLACRDAKHLVAVGGNYSRPDASAVTVALSDDGGASWTASPPDPSTAFLSGVAYLDRAEGQRLVGVGTEGTALSVDGGRHWSRLDSLSLNVVMSAENGAAWAAGTRGSVVALAGLTAQKRQ